MWVGFTTERKRVIATLLPQSGNPQKDVLISAFKSLDLQTCPPHLSSKEQKQTLQIICNFLNASTEKSQIQALRDIMQCNKVVVYISLNNAWHRKHKWQSLSYPFMSIDLFLCEPPTVWEQVCVGVCVHGRTMHHHSWLIMPLVWSTAWDMWDETHANNISRCDPSSTKPLDKEKKEGFTWH